MRHAGWEELLFAAAMVFIACSGGPDQGPISGPGPGPGEPGEGIERGDNPFDFGSNAVTTDVSTVTTGPGECITCLDVLNGTFQGDICNESAAAVTAIANCGCGICASECAASLCGAQPLDADCASCMNVECPSDLQNCQVN